MRVNITSHHTCEHYITLYVWTLNHTIRVNITSHYTCEHYITLYCDHHNMRVNSTVWFLHAECNFYTQSVISKRSVILTRRNVITTLTTVISTRKTVIFTRRVWCWHVWVWLWHSACRNHSFVWCSHAYCDEHTHECNFWTQSVNLTRTALIYIRRVWFIFVECEFHTQSVISTHRV
jgi:hypothetical protein